jgi:hypothetical protein
MCPSEADLEDKLALLTGKLHKIAFLPSYFAKIRLMFYIFLSS